MKTLSKKLIGVLYLYKVYARISLSVYKILSKVGGDRKKIMPFTKDIL